MILGQPGVGLGPSPPAVAFLALPREPHGARNGTGVLSSLACALPSTRSKSLAPLTFFKSHCQIILYVPYSVFRAYAIFSA